VQPFCAALLAGIIGAVVTRWQLSSLPQLVAVCPCMVLVPGPHFLNGAIDLARTRIALGACRIGYASLITLVISVGLLAGLSLGGVELPASSAAAAVPLGYDVIAAGVAVAAYGTFFAMPAHAADPDRHWHACAEGPRPGAIRFSKPLAMRNM
jgi:Putative threonine/serine exporter